MSPGAWPHTSEMNQIKSIENLVNWKSNILPTGNIKLHIKYYWIVIASAQQSNTPHQFLARWHFIIIISIIFLLSFIVIAGAVFIVQTIRTTYRWRTCRLTMFVKMKVKIIWSTQAPCNKGQKTDFKLNWQIHVASNICYVDKFLSLSASHSWFLSFYFALSCASSAHGNCKAIIIIISIMKHVMVEIWKSHHFLVINHWNDACYRLRYNLIITFSFSFSFLFFIHFISAWQQSNERWVAEFEFNET